MAWAFRKDRLLAIINTNNGVERQNKAFKYDYLEGYKHSTLNVMLTILIEDFLPDHYFKWVILCLDFSWNMLYALKQEYNERDL